MNIGQIVVEAVLFFHPAVWWVSRRIRIERENCCDDMAVALCDGDRLLLARALFVMEEQRGMPILRVAASGGSMRDRVRRLVLPTSSVANPAEAGWAGAGLIAAAVGLIAVAWLAGSSHARDDAPRGGKASVNGRVLDEAGKPVAGARVRLYRREGRWERHHPMIEETTAGADGSYRLTSPLEAIPAFRSRGLPPYVLLADHPGKAVGWRTIPIASTTFEGDVTLTAPTERTITVIDADGRPVPGAKVVTYYLGDPSSTSPLFREGLELFRPDDGPLTAIADANGRATFRQLPRTGASFVATKPGFAEGYAFREQGTIHITPSATLSGVLTGPDGKPLKGVKVVVNPTFIWDFEHAVTDAMGQYQFADLKARGWNQSNFIAGGSNETGNGTHKVWIESDRFAVPTQTITLEPKTHETLNLQAEVAGVIRATVTEDGTDKPVANVRIWGFDQATGNSSRFNAYTDTQGRATFYSTPETIWLGIVGPPEGYYLKGDVRQWPDASKRFDFPGGETEVRLVMPRIAGSLITVSGICTRPDGSPAAGAGINPAAGHFVTSGTTNYIRMRRADGAGRFTLEAVPAGQTLHLYAETEDRQFAGTATVRMPDKANPQFRLNVPMAPTVVVDIVFQDSRGKPLPSRKFHISPNVEQEDFPFVRRTVESDAEGRVKVDGIVPGLSYRVQEDVPPQPRSIPVPPAGSGTWFDKVLVLAPKEGK